MIRLLLSLFLVIGLSGVAFASEAHPAAQAAKEEMREPHPDVPHHASWAPKLLVGIAVLFAAAIPIGLLARSVLVAGRAEETDSHGHGDHGHGHDDHGHGAH